MNDNHRVGPVLDLNRRPRNHARKADPVQAMRVKLAIRWGLPVSEVGRWRAEIELEEQRARVGRLVARNGDEEEVLAWQ